MFNFEEWLKKTYVWEDISSAILVMASDKHGGVYLSSYNGDKEAEGKTLEEVCKNWEMLYGK